MDVQEANVAMLKQRLSHYLRLVEAGQEVVVTSHRRPVARLTSAPVAGVSILPPTRPVADLPAVKGVVRVSGHDIVEMFEEDRRRPSQGKGVA